MRPRPSSFVARLLGAQVAVACVVAVVTGFVAPRLLLADDDARDAIAGLTWIVAPPLIAVAAALAYVRLRRLDFLLRALAVGSTAIDPSDVLALTKLPQSVVLSSIAAVFVGLPAALLSPLRPDAVDPDTAVGITAMGLVMSATAAMPLYQLVRARVAGVLDLVPTDVTRAVLDAEERHGGPRTRTRRRLLAALVPPVGLVAVGATLIAHAHVRSLDEAARLRTVEDLAHAAFEPAPGPLPHAGRGAAYAAAAAHGFVGRHEPRARRFDVVRRRDGSMQVTLPVDDGVAHVRVAAPPVPIVDAPYVALATFAMLLVAALALVAAEALAEDLDGATARIRSLGVDRVRKGDAGAAPRARFIVVADLNRAIDAVAERFRAFEAARSRAIEAREAAERARSLVFASASHDLKSPLNAVVGFASLLGGAQITAAQRESVELIERRARELLWLIEIILGVAKAEGGEIDVVRARMDVRGVVDDATRLVRAVAGDVGGWDVKVAVDEDVPVLVADRAELTRALAAVLDYALRLRGLPDSPREPAWPVRVRASATTDPAGAAIAVEHLHGAASPEQVARILAGEPLGGARRRYGALALRLTLARALVEAHGGSLRVVRTGRRTSTVTLRVPSEPTA